MSKGLLGALVMLMSVSLIANDHESDSESSTSSYEGKYTLQLENGIEVKRCKGMLVLIGKKTSFLGEDFNGLIDDCGFKVDCRMSDEELKRTLGTVSPIKQEFYK